MPGVRLAGEVSDAIAHLGIPIGLVRSSPVLRAADTDAIVARGQPVDVTMDLVADDYTADIAAAAG